MKIRHVNSREHLDCERLLSWYSNATLTDTEHLRVQEHLQLCGDCRRQLRELEQLASTVGRPDEVTPLPQASFDKLMQRIDENAHHERGAAPQGETGGRLGARMAGFLDWWLRPLPITPALLALGLIVGFAFLLWPAGHAPQSVYHTLGETPALKEDTHNTHIHLVLAEQASILDLRLLLQPLGARISDGPTERGVFTVTLPASEQTPHPAVQSLREDSRVLFAELAVSSLPAPTPSVGPRQ